VLMIRRIRDLLYDQGFTISGARNRLQELVHSTREQTEVDGSAGPAGSEFPSMLIDSGNTLSIHAMGYSMDSNAVRKELFEIRALLSPN